MTDLNYPDGGYGWIVLAGVCLVNMCTQSITSTFSLLFREHLENLDQQMYGAALLSSLNSIFLNFSGLITGPAIKIFKPRKVAIIGCLLVSIGLIISAISNKMWHMIVGYGVLVGIGLGLISPSNLMISHTYFMKKRSLVIGLSYCGTGIGQIILPLFIPLLLTKYGYFITVLITATISLNGLLGASLFRPIKTQKIINNNKNNTNLLELNNNNEIRLLTNNDDDDRNNNNNNNNNNNDQVLSTELKDENEMKSSSIKLSSSSSSPIKNKNIQMNRLRTLIIESLKTISRAMDLELIKDLKFCNIIFGIGVAYTVSINFSVLFPYYLQSSAKLSSAQVSYCVSILACSDTLFRLLLPTFTYKLNLSYRFIFLLGIIGLCINRFLLILFKNNLYLIYIITGLYGFSKSLTIVNNALAISQYIENNDKLSGALGLNMIMKGILSVILGQFLGWIKDYTDSYVACFLMQNFLMCIVIILWCIEYLYKFVKYRRMKRLIHNVNNKIDDN